MIIDRTRLAPLVQRERVPERVRRGDDAVDRGDRADRAREDILRLLDRARRRVYRSRALAGLHRDEEA